jgi:hypothetical protein
MHDLFYLLCCREEDGDFTDNRAKGGAGSDRVTARVWRDPIPRTARFVTPPDGSSPKMDMGPVAETGRHCAPARPYRRRERRGRFPARLAGGRRGSASA